MLTPIRELKKNKDGKGKKIKKKHNVDRILYNKSGVLKHPNQQSNSSRKALDSSYEKKNTPATGGFNRSMRTLKNNGILGKPAPESHRSKRHLRKDEDSFVMVNKFHTERDEKPNLEKRFANRNHTALDQGIKNRRQHTQYLKSQRSFDQLRRPRIENTLLVRERLKFLKEFFPVFESK